MVKGIHSKPTPSEPLGNATPNPSQSSVPASPEPISTTQSSVPTSSESTQPAQSSVPASNVAPQQNYGAEPLGNATSHSLTGIDSPGSSTAETLPAFVDDDVEFPAGADETLALPVSRVESFVEGDFVPLEEPEPDTAELQLGSLSLSDRVRVVAETDRYRVGDDYVALMVAEPDVDVASVLAMSTGSEESSEPEVSSGKTRLVVGLCGAVVLAGLGITAFTLFNDSDDSSLAGASSSPTAPVETPSSEPTPEPTEGIPSPEQDVLSSSVPVPTPTVIEIPSEVPTSLPTALPTDLASLPVEETKESLLQEAKNWNPFADNSAPVADLAITVDSAYPAQSGDVIVIGQGITVPYHVVNCPASESCAPTNINPSKNNGNTKGDSSQYRLDFGYMSTTPVGDYDATKVVDAINSTIESLSMPMDKISTVDLNSARSFSSGYALVPVNDVFFIIGKSGIMQSVKSYGVVNYPYNGVGIEQTYADLPSVTVDNLPKTVNNSADATSEPTRWVSPR